MVAFFASRSCKIAKAVACIACLPILIMGPYRNLLILLRAIIFVLSHECSGCSAFVLGNRAVPRCYQTRLGLVCESCGLSCDSLLVCCASKKNS